MERRQRTRLATGGVLALVFTSGSLTGVAFQRGLGDDTEAALASAPADTPDPTPPTEQRRLPMYAQVGMSEEQLAEAGSLVQQWRGPYRALYADYQQDRDSIVASTGRELEWRHQADSLVANIREQLKVLMTAEQVVSYDSLLIENDSRREQRQREGRSGGDRRN